MQQQAIHSQPNRNFPAMLRPRRFQDLVEAYEPSAHGGYRARVFIEDDDDLTITVSYDGSPRELRFD